MPLEVLKVIPKIVRPNDLLGAYVSGCRDQTKMLNRYPSVAAFEVLVFETNPRPEWNEGSVNAYHYIIYKSGRTDFPYILCGPFNDDTIIGHHPSDLNLEVYNKQQP